MIKGIIKRKCIFILIILIVIFWLIYIFKNNNKSHILDNNNWLISCSDVVWWIIHFSWNSYNMNNFQVEKNWKNLWQKCLNFIK